MVVTLCDRNTFQYLQMCFACENLAVELVFKDAGKGYLNTPLYCGDVYKYMLIL